ncbi:MAG: hypothetical protein IJ390_09365, partial [Lachnospiraceae bacterium]|nr:hypothetical protein [Lachnospiraceae bacterium]
RPEICHPASFRFVVTNNTLALGYVLPTTGRIWDFHPLETCAARRTRTDTQFPAGNHVSVFFPGRLAAFFYFD